MMTIRYPTDVFPDLYNYEPVLSPKKKKCQKARWLSEEALQIAEKKVKQKAMKKRKDITI